jgi:hypothetical protein
MRTRFVLAILAMVAIVASSNYLVQFPVQGRIGGIDLANVLTWGAFTYPVAFLVTDLTNRHFGPKLARMVVLFGFAIAVMVSIFLASPRIAIASGLAFLLAQFLDVTIFDNMRANPRWWRPPFISSTLGSILDTVLFWGVAFSASLGFIDVLFGMKDSSLGFATPFWDVGPEVPLWVSLALGDFTIKMLVALILLAPYGALRRVISDRVLDPETK